MNSATCFRRWCGVSRKGVGLLLCVMLGSGFMIAPFPATVQASAQEVPQATPVAPDEVATDTPPSTEPAPPVPAPDLPTPISSKVVPTLTLAVTSDAIVGKPVLATASLRNGDQPTGRVTFTIFSGEVCEGDSYVQRSVALNADAEFIASKAETFVEAGLFAWQATYSGDATNDGVVSDCVLRPVVAPDTLALTVTQGNEVAFGALTAPGTATTAEGGDYTYVMTDAVTVEVTGGTGPWVVECSMVGGQDGVELAWQLDGTTSWTPFADGPCFAAVDGGDRTLAFHYRLRVDPAADPGPFAFEVTYAVSPLVLW